MRTLRLLSGIPPPLLVLAAAELLVVTRVVSVFPCVLWIRSGYLDLELAGSRNPFFALFLSGSDQLANLIASAFRDRGAGSDRNHARSTEEAARGSGRGGAGARVRGGKFVVVTRG